MNCKHIFDDRGICKKCYITEMEAKWWPSLNEMNRDTVRNQIKNRTPRRLPTVDELI
jgi:predicted Fe-S protein YdhL (DUF1289 family)